MKQRNNGVETAQGLLSNWPTALVGWLAFAGAAAAAQGDSGASVSAAAATARPTMYRVTNLGPGDVGIAINAKGQVAFTRADPFAGPSQAWFYDGARLHQIGTLGGTFARTTDLNDAGQVTGVSDTANGFIHSFVWSRQRGMTDIGTLPGRQETWEPVINNRGEVAGYATGNPSPPYPHAFRWSAGGGIEDLGVLLNGDSSSSYARAINDAGLIAGDAWAGGSDYHAFVWTRTSGMVDIDTLGNSYSSAVAVGARGQVTGNILNPPDNFGSVFWWTRAAGMRDLGTANGQGAWMVDMSPGGRIAGVITYPDFSQHAMTWTTERGMRDLGTLGGSSSNANAANDLGQVVGGAATANDSYHAFVWTERDGMLDLNRRLYRAPAGLVLDSALAISDKGAIVAASNAGLVLLEPVRACPCSHAAGPIVSAEVVRPGEPVDTSISFATEDSAARYDVIWSWGDGTSDRPRGASASNGVGSANARHNYAAPGIYTITANVTDQAGNSVKVGRRIVVYEPSGGVVAGSGAVVLPTAAGQRSRVAGGKAHFSFVTAPAAKAKASGAQGAFLFSLPGFAFASDDVRVSAAQGARARLAGTGKVNGAGGYRFTATTTSGSGGGTAGQFSVKIWHTDPKTSAEIVDFDSQASASGAAGRPLVEGRIAVQ